jgi:hypothetical protein
MKLSINQLRKIISEEVRRFKINENESQEFVTVEVQVPSLEEDDFMKSFGRESGVDEIKRIKSVYSTGAGPDSRATYPEDPGHWTIYHVKFVSEGYAEDWKSSHEDWIVEPINTPPTDAFWGTNSRRVY